MTLLTLGLVYAVFFLAAFLKGITGLGFSTISLPLLSSFLDLQVGIPLVLIPSLSSNLLVMVQAGHFWPVCRRFWPLYVSALPGLVLGVQVLRSTPGDLSRGVLGSVLCLYALWALWSKPLVLSKRAAAWLAVPVGFTTGVINGLTGSQVMPVLPFLLALPLSKDAFVQAINVSFTLSSLVMLAVLGRVGLLTPGLAAVAALGILPVALGIALGGRLRRRLPEAHFRKAVLLFLLLIGLTLVGRLVR
ncbi:MAG: hypothetical protein KatS3mg131_3495 [Candidatus Tectimicrobiota bacterium]|nr:MAG: hypothetical protein KatS3mg131_3495 [Candidatus Tectomicrobia bacterium]